MLSFVSLIDMFADLRPLECRACKELTALRQSFACQTFFYSSGPRNNSQLHEAFFCADTRLQFCARLFDLLLCANIDHSCSERGKDFGMSLALACATAQHDLRQVLRDYWCDNLPQLLQLESAKKILHNLRKLIDADNNTTLLRFCRRLAAHIDDDDICFFASPTEIVLVGRVGHRKRRRFAQNHERQKQQRQKQQWQQQQQKQLKFQEQQKHTWKREWLRKLDGVIADIRKAIFARSESRDVNVPVDVSALATTTTMQSEGNGTATLQNPAGNNTDDDDNNKQQLAARKYFATRKWLPCDIRCKKMPLQIDASLRLLCRNTVVQSAVAAGTKKNIYPLHFNDTHIGTKLLVACYPAVRVALRVAAETIEIDQSNAGDLSLCLEGRTFTRNADNGRFLYRLLADSVGRLGGERHSAQRVQLVRLYESNRLSLLHLLQAARARFDTVADLKAMKLSWF